MESREAIRAIMERQGLGIAAVGRRIGVTMIMASNRLSSKNMTVRVLGEFCKALGYKIVLMPAEKKVPKDCYEITHRGGEEE